MGLGCQRLGEADHGGGGRGRKHTRQCGTGQRTGRIQSYLDPISHIRNLSDFTMVINTSVDVEWIKELNGILFTVLSLADILFRSNFIHSEFV